MVLNEDIATLWREEVVTHVRWKRATDQSGGSQGESGGFYVVASGLPRRAYLKPGRRLPDAAQKRRAAREKIAADLAHDLSLPVPPAVLWRRPASQAGAEEHVVVSLVLYRAEIPWASVVHASPGAGTPEALALGSVLASCTPMLAFDTWLDHDEHGDHHAGNIVWGYNPTQPSDSAMTFLDFASSMGADGSWTADEWTDVRLARFPTRMLECLDPDALERTLEEILALEEEKIEHLVHRIPDDFLPIDQKRVITGGLVGRRESVARLLRKGGRP